MVESHDPDREAHPSSGHAIRAAIEEARGNMRIVREARDRAEERAEVLEKQLAEARRVAADAAGREEELSGKLEKRGLERDGIGSQLIDARKENERLRLELKDLFAKFTVLAEKTGHSEHMVEEREDLQRRISEAASVVASQESLIADLQERLRKVESEAEKGRRAAEDTLSRQRQRIDALEARVAKLSEEDKDLTRQLGEAPGTIKDLRTQLESEREVRKALEFDLDLLRTSVRRLRRAVGEMLESERRSISDLEKAIGGVRGDPP